MAKASFIHCFAFITRLGSIVMRGLTAPGPINEHAFGVCIATWIGFQRQDFCASRRVRTNFYILAIARFCPAPHFDGVELEHVNLRSGYTSVEEIPGDFPEKKPRRAKRLGSH
jgi:hypothetical protein